MDAFPDSLHNLQHDLFGRYAVLRRLAHCACPASENGKVSVLDIGSGPNLLSQQFLGPDYEVTRTDVESHGDPGIVLIPTEGPLPFASDSFDAVVAMDVLEHVAGNNRGVLISECVRIARRVAIVAAPLGDPEVVEAESLLNTGHQVFYDKPLSFLNEHAELGLPTRAEVRALSAAAGVLPMELDHAPIQRWLARALIDLSLAGLLDNHAAKDFVNRPWNDSDGGCYTTGQHYRCFYVYPKRADLRNAFEGLISEIRVPVSEEVLAPPPVQVALEFRRYIDAKYNLELRQADRALQGQVRSPMQAMGWSGAEAKFQLLRRLAERGVRWMRCVKIRKA